MKIEDSKLKIARLSEKAIIFVRYVDIIMAINSVKIPFSLNRRFAQIQQIETG